MCGTCRSAPVEPRLRGPADREALARAVEAATGLRTRAVIGMWTLATPTGRQVVCATPEALAEAAAALGRVDPDAVLEASWAAVARDGARRVASGQPGSDRDPLFTDGTRDPFQRG